MSWPQSAGLAPIVPHDAARAIKSVTAFPKSMPFSFGDRGSTGRVRTSRNEGDPRNDEATHLL